MQNMSNAALGDANGSLKFSQNNNNNYKPGISLLRNLANKNSQEEII